MPFNSTDLSQIKENPYSFTNLSHVVYIEQPVGTGFTEGEPHLENQEQTAQEFLGFFEQFLATFPELQNKKLWLTGESYAGKVSNLFSQATLP